jgi:Ca2+-binding EF-hand superfamily protein
MVNNTGLPFLPGNTFSDNTRVNFHKKQTFQKGSSGIPIIKDAPEGAPAPSVVPPPPQHEEPVAAAAPAVPAYVALDRMVLRFFAYYKEAVHESRMENYRVRKVTILYYLEDNTLQVNEPKEENSGIPQGAFIKRHHIPKGRGEFYTVLDFELGTDISFYGRTFRLVDCDAFTAQFFQENGLNLGDPEDYPYNPFDAQYTVMKQKEVENRGMSSVKTDDLMHWTEAMLGKPTNLINEDKLAQFLKYDRRVLRFYCMWDDTPSLYGEVRRFVLHYYLADDTVEIVESYKSNSGRDPFPKLLNRQKLPIEWDKPGRKEFYTAADLTLGGTVTVFGRDLLVCDCDDFTKQFMEENFNHAYDGRTISLEEERPEPPRREIPPYTGYGSEEDSLGSFYSLVPKPPHQNWAKYFENDKKILRFVAQLDTNAPEDRERLFIISYYLADDTIGVYEPPARNSGFMGGKFMERCRAKGAGADAFYKPTDMYVGSVMEFRKHRFVLIEADEYTLNYMENKKFPSSDVSAIVEKLKDKFRESSVLIRDSFRRFDRDHSGALNMAEFRDALRQFNFDVSDQELITIMRKFDPNGDGSIRYDEFCSSVLEEDYKAVEHSSGGQVMHGENAHTKANREAQEKVNAEDEHKMKQERLNELLGAFREQLFPYKDQIQPMFAAVDTTGDGHVNYDDFKKVLEQMGVQVDEQDLELLVESFFDPDVEDQTRPMSIAVLDEALFG